MRFFFLLLPLFLFSLNLSEILTHPKSYVRDFYLTEFMKETNSTALAFKAYNSLYRVKRFKHLRILAKKSKEFAEIYKCINVKPSYINEVDVSCILNNSLSLGSMARLKRSELLRLYNSLPECREKRAIKILLDKNYKDVFKNRELGYYFLLHYPTKKIDQYIKNFTIFETSSFYRFVKYAVIHDMKKIQNSLLKIKYSHLGDRAKWWLFLNAMKHKKYKLAKKILYSINNQKSKILFWKWLFGDKKAYKQLLTHSRVNMYTLYAYEKAGKKFLIKTDIIYNSVKKPLYDQTNPWDVLKFWSDLKNRKDLFYLAKQLDSDKSIALKALALDKAFHYKYNMFITPKFYTSKDKSFQAFVYAIARQESRFVPASVSRSYALGTMQIMPFLVRDMKGDVFNQFDYGENIKLGVRHLKWLFKRLKDPLMVAYAYNGGIGFVNRRVKPYFKYRGKFEPFLSMELVPYDESREYGKKVIANYIIYSHIFGDKKKRLRDVLKSKF